MLAGFALGWEMRTMEMGSGKTDRGQRSKGKRESSVSADPDDRRASTAADKKLTEEGRRFIQSANVLIPEKRIDPKDVYVYLPPKMYKRNR